MAASITATGYLTDISLCESTTGWTGAGGTNSDFANQGTYCLGLQVKNTTSATIYFTPSSPIDCSGGKHIYFWVLITGKPDTKANGGIQLYAYTDASNYGYWNVGGSDNYNGGWVCFCFDPSTGGAGGAGTVNAASIARIGIRFKTLTTIAGTSYNCFWDAVRYGTGYKVTSGATDQIGLAEIYAIDDNSTYKYGVVQKEAMSGDYIIQGHIVGGGTGAENLDFVDTNKIIVFPANEFVSATFYGITVQRGSGTVNFVLGAKSGTAGISGCVIKAAGTKVYSFDVSDDLTVLGLYGCTFDNAGLISLPENAANREMLNCNLNVSEGVEISTCVVQNCNFISADDEAIVMSDDDHNLSDCNFINNPNAVRIDTAGTYEFDNMKFTGNTNDIDNTSGGTVIVNCVNGSDPSTETGDTTINNAVVLTVQGVKTTTEPTNYVRCHIEKVSDQTVLMNEEAQTSYGSEGYYKATESYNYTGDVDVIIRARYKGYLPFETTGTVTSAGLTVTAVWIPDPNFN